MFDANIMAGVDAAAKTQQAVNTGFDSLGQQTKNQFEKAKLAEWKSPEQVDARKAAALAAKEASTFQQKSDYFKNQAINDNPEMAAQIANTGMQVQLMDHLNKLDDDHMNNLVSIGGDWDGKPESYADIYKAWVMKDPKLVDGLPSPTQMAQDPSQGVKVKLFMSGAMKDVATRRTMAIEQQKAQGRLQEQTLQNQGALQRTIVGEQGANSRAQLQANTQLTKNADEIQLKRDLDESKKQAAKDLANQSWQMKNAQLDKQLSNKTENARIRAQAGGKGDSPLKFNTDSGIANQKAATNDAGMYLTGRLDSEGLDKKLAPQIAPDVVAKASTIWQAENAAYSARLKAGDPDALPPRNGREIIQQLSEQAIQNVTKKSIPVLGDDKYKPIDTGTIDQPAPKQQAPAEPKSKEEYDALPAGALYIKNGKTLKKGG